MGQTHASRRSQAGFPHPAFAREEQYPHISILDRARVAALYTGLVTVNGWTKTAPVVAVFALCFSLLCAQPVNQAEAGDSARGKTVFGGQCAVCHNADSTVKKLGPGLKGLFKTAKLVNGKPVNEANVRAVIDAGGNGMPPFKEMLKPSQKDDLIAYLKTL